MRGKTTMRTILGVVAVMAAFALAAPAWAHHIIGLPHYAYKDNYPQAPVLEYPATTGPYDVLLTSYPGRPEPAEVANIVIYIKDRETGEPYLTPISLRIETQAMFGRGREILPATPRDQITNQFKYGITFPSAGEYIVELTMDVEGQTEVIPFLMVAGNPRAPATVPLALAGGLGLFFIVVRAIKLKRARRARAAGATEQPAAASRGSHARTMEHRVPVHPLRGDRGACGV